MAMGASWFRNDNFFYLIQNDTCMWFKVLFKNYLTTLLHMVCPEMWEIAQLQTTKLADLI